MQTIPTARCALRAALSGRSATLHHLYRDKIARGRLLYLKDGAVRLIEVKKGVSPPKPTKSFRVLKKYKMPLLPGMVVDCADAVSPINENAFVCPIALVGA